MRKIRSAALAIAITAPFLQMPSTGAVDDINTTRLRDAVTVGGMLGHERVFQRIANNNEGTRASGTRGYKQSANYVERTLTNAGYTVRTQEFTFPFFRNVSPAELQQLTPTPTDYETDTFEYSGSGEVIGQVVPTNDVMVPPGAEPSSSNSGCEPGDFTPASTTEDQVALIQRGTCFFEDKARNAEAAGYDAVIIFNEGQEGRTDLLTGTLSVPFDIPVVGLSFADGAALYEATQDGPVTVRVFTDTQTNLAATTKNVIASLPGGNNDKVVLAGGHLDSVADGPGINDNGSGTATLLEIAEQMAELDIHTRQKLRFAFWGAEESGLHGSTNYVNELSNAQLGRVKAYLNFDMVGSPNYVRFVFDGNGSDLEPAGPPGSAQIERIFNRYFSSQDLESDPTPLGGTSDYAPFMDVGIPIGGIFTGATGIKTEEQAEVYGGTAGEAYDSCYHEACDRVDRLNTKALSEMSDAAAHGIMTLAKTKSGFFEDGSLRVGQRVVVKPGARFGQVSR
ncbi:MAG: M20/M25/M40 family metallo-hydrolase [Nocardioidaceae bacterium]|nr:M20/M25/M40 family metallo-hydrolase [Nocardioidaceae bacterium]